MSAACSSSSYFSLRHDLAASVHIFQPRRPFITPAMALARDHAAPPPKRRRLDQIGSYEELPEPSSSPPLSTSPLPASADDSRENARANDSDSCAVRLPAAWASRVALGRQLGPSSSLQPFSGGLGYLLVLPGFLQEARRDATGKLCRNILCSPSLRRFLTDALRRARDAIGPWDDSLPPRATLIAAVVHEGTQSNSGNAHRRTRSISRWCVAGVCLALDIDRAWRAHPEREDTSASSTAAPARSVGDVWCSGTVYCGILLLWTAAMYRKRGIAHQMVEGARRHVCYGYVVPCTAVAFWEPSGPGSAFARRYTDRDDFLCF